MSFEVELVAGADAFLGEAGPLLLAEEARNNLILGIARTVSASPGRFPVCRFWVARDERGAAAAALRTPPYNLVLGTPRDRTALEALAGGIVDDLPGVVAARPEVDDFVRLWTRGRGLSPLVLRRQGVYAIESVEPIPSVSGSSRPATPADRPLLLEWLAAFGAEVLPEGDPGREEAVATVDHRLGADDGGFLLWEDGGESVSAAGWGGPTPNGIRIGPVYTPPARRGRGYATALVAELSATLLAGGRRFCFLYTDLANPTSNAIYARIGYRRVCEAAMVAFRAK